MALNPLCLTKSTNALVILGLPQFVSPPMASSVFPILNPSFILAANCTALLLIPVASAGILSPYTLADCRIFISFEMLPALTEIIAERSVFKGLD